MDVASTHMNDDELLNKSALEDLCEDTGKEILPTLVNSFLEHSQERYADITTAIAKQDLAELEHHAHALRSSAATFGAACLRTLVSDIEEACQNNQPQQAFELAGHVLDVGAKTETALKAYLANF